MNLRLKRRRCGQLCKQHTNHVFFRLWAYFVRLEKKPMHQHVQVAVGAVEQQEGSASVACMMSSKLHAMETGPVVAAAAPPLAAAALTLATGLVAAALPLATGLAA